MRGIEPIDLDKLFPNEWIADRKKYLKSTEAPDAGDLGRSFGRDMRFTLYLFTMVMIAVGRMKPGEGAQIFLDTEKVCNRLGITGVEKRQTIESCLTKNHSDCDGYYENVLTGDHIICKCKCHLNRF